MSGQELALKPWVASNHSISIQRGQGSAYRKPAFQPSAFRRLFIGFQPSAENQPISMEKGKNGTMDKLHDLAMKFFYQSENF